MKVLERQLSRYQKKFRNGEHMNKKQLITNISNIIEDIERLKRSLYAMQTTDIIRYPDNYEIMALAASTRSETIACGIRSLIYNSTDFPRKDLMVQVAEAQQIEIKEIDNILEIDLPRLLPKKGNRRGGEFLTDPLYFTLQTYTKGKEALHFKECIVCFLHIYANHLSKNRIRDYDNVEKKQVLDTVAAFLLEDDGGFLCDVYHTIALGEKDYTKIFIMEKDKFPNWLLQYQKSESYRSDFC